MEESETNTFGGEKSFKDALFSADFAAVWKTIVSFVSNIDTDALIKYAQANPLETAKWVALVFSPFILLFALNWLMTDVPVEEEEAQELSEETEQETEEDKVVEIQEITTSETVKERITDIPEDDGIEEVGE